MAPKPAHPSSSAATFVAPPSQRIEEAETRAAASPQSSQSEVKSPAPRGPPPVIPHPAPAQSSTSSSASRLPGPPPAPGEADDDTDAVDIVLSHPNAGRAKMAGRGAVKKKAPQLKNTITDPLENMFAANSPASEAAKRVFARLSRDNLRSSEVGDYIVQVCDLLRSTDPLEVEDVLKVLVHLTDNVETCLLLKEYPLVDPIAFQVAREGDDVDRKLTVARLIVNVLKSPDNLEYWANSKTAMDALKDQVAQAQVWITMDGERRTEYHDLAALSCQCFLYLSRNLQLRTALIGHHVADICYEIVLNKQVSMRALLFSCATLLHLADPDDVSGVYSVQERNALQLIEKALSHADARARSLALDIVGAIVAQTHQLTRLINANFLIALLDLSDQKREHCSVVVDMEALRLMTLFLKEKSVWPHLYRNLDPLKKYYTTLSKSNAPEPVKQMAKLILEDMKLVKK